jgi:hypothetical protein
MMINSINLQQLSGSAQTAIYRHTSCLLDTCKNTYTNADKNLSAFSMCTLAIYG